MDVVVIAVHVVKVFNVMFLFKISAICNTFFLVCRKLKQTYQNGTCLTKPFHLCCSNFNSTSELIKKIVWTKRDTGQPTLVACSKNNRVQTYTRHRKDTCTTLNTNTYTNN